MPMSLFEVLTHELAEAMVDPSVNRYALAPDGKMWLIEIGDQADAYRFVVDIPTLLINGRPKTRAIAQDFTLPAYYEPATPAPYSHTGKVSGAWKIDTGCYAYVVHRARPPLSELIGWVASRDPIPVLVR